MAHKHDITLYFAPQTRAVRVRWLLEELGASYHLHRFDMKKGEHKSPEFLQVNPLGQVPTIVDHRHGNVHQTESAAILIYLAESYNKLQPAPGTPDRAPYLQWIVYVPGAMEEPLLKVFLNGERSFLPAEKRRPELIEEGKKRFNELVVPIKRALEGKEYLVGNQFTAADIMIGGSLNWGNSMGLLADHKELQEYVKRVTSRPAFVRANAD